jgi:hypothetical protein
MSYIDIQFAAVRLRARLLADVAPVTTAAFRNALPLEGRAFQDQYSAQIMRITSRLEVDAAGDRTFGYQHAGLVMLDPTTSELAVLRAWSVAELARAHRRDSHRRGRWRPH